jgi:hypothetical protein
MNMTNRGNQNRTTVIDISAELASLRENARALRDNAAAMHGQAESLDEAADRLAREMKMAKGTREVRKVDPKRPFFVGDDAPIDVLFEAVEQCITGPDPRQSARTLREIVEVTGCSNRNRISGILVKLQVRGRKLKNLGDRKRAIWWIPPPKKPFSSKTER